jgi:hypothetical protein
MVFFRWILLFPLPSVWQDFPFPREAPVVRALNQQHYINHNKLYGKNNHGRQDALDYGPHAIEDIAQ